MTEQVGQGGREQLLAEGRRLATFAARIRRDLDDPTGAILNPHPYLAALRAVLDLHPPRQVGTLTPWHLECVGCSMRHVTSMEWPCKTVLVIARELGVPVQDGDASGHD